MIDTPENIEETIKELNDWLATIDASAYEDMDLSYLDDDEGEIVEETKGNVENKEKESANPR